MDRYRLSVWGIVMFAVAGLLISGYLSYLSLAPSGSCPVGEFSIFSCDRVIYSEYAHPLGIPVSVMGLGWFVIALGLAWLARRNTGLMRYVVVWSLMGLVGVVGLVYVELFLVGAVCVFCTIAHVCGLVILALSLAGWRSRGVPVAENGSE